MKLQITYVVDVDVESLMPEWLWDDASQRREENHRDEICEEAERLVIDWDFISIDVELM